MMLKEIIFWSTMLIALPMILGGRQPPIYPGLSTVWGSPARYKAKGYRVGPVYDDVLAMAWFFLELIVKLMALEKPCLFCHSLPIGEDIPPMHLKDGA